MTFEEMYARSLAQTPMINVQQQQVRMPNWLSAGFRDPGNQAAAQFVANQFNQLGAADRSQQALDIERDRARQLADIQMQTFQAKQAQIEQARQAREAYAAENPAMAAQIMAGQDPTDFQRKMAEAGGDPERYREMFGPGAGTSVEVKLPGEMTEQQKVVGKFFGEEYVNLQKAGREAYKQNANLDRLDDLLEQTYTGIGGKEVLAAQKAAKMLGFDVEGIGQAEAAQSIANELALQLRNPAGGAGMPGAMSDRDREFLQSMVPGLAMTDEGRRSLIDTKKKLNQRSVEVAKMARDYRKKFGTLDDGFFDELAQYSEENQLFTERDQGEVEGMSQEDMNELKMLRQQQGF